jgi:hypothetical protein
MDILDRLRRSVTKGHEPTDEDAIDAAAEIERLRAALQWIEAQAGNVDPSLIKHMCNRTLAGLDPANIYVDR